MLANRASGKYGDFERHMLWYINIVAPLIRSLWSLEAAHANASDVFVFWLAAAATLNDLFSKSLDETGIPRELANQVTTIYNSRYEEFFQNDLYFVAFLLDPRAVFNSHPALAACFLTEMITRFFSSGLPQKITYHSYSIPRRSSIRTNAKSCSDSAPRCL